MTVPGLLTMPEHGRLPHLDGAVVQLGGGGDLGARLEESAAFVTYLSASAPGQRLSIARSGSRTTLFDGWLSRRAELARALDRPEEGEDADLVAAAYDRWGMARLPQLRGSFVFCIVDEAEPWLIAGRDPVGVTPLFYAHAAGQWLLSPSVEALRRHPAVSGTVDREMVATHLLGEGRDVTRSFYTGIRRLLPGHVLHARAGSSDGEVRRSWSPLGADEVPRWTREDEVDRFPALLSEAVERYLELGQAGIYLSGGLDSGTVATVAADVARSRGVPLPHAYSLVFDDPASNEEYVQRGVAAALDVPHTIVPINLTTDPIAAYEESLALNDDWPHPLTSTFRSVYLSLGRRAVRDGSDLILTGDGGDEWLAIHTSLAADLLRRLDFAELRNLIETVRSTHGLPRLRASHRVLVEHGAQLLIIADLARAGTRFAPNVVARRRRRLASDRLPSWFAPDRELRDAVVDRLSTTPNVGTAYGAAIVRDTLEHPLTLLYMEESFESGRRIGAPILKPFYDPDVVTFLVHMPPHLRSQGGQFKGLLRTLLHRRFPALGFDRQPKPYATNFNATMVFEGFARDPTGGRGFPALARLGIVDEAKVGALISHALHRGAGADGLHYAKTMWLLQCAERWVRSRGCV